IRPLLSMMTPEPRTPPPSIATVAGATFLATRTWTLSTSSWAWRMEANATRKAIARPTGFMRAPAESLFLPDSLSRTYNIRRLRIPWVFNISGGCHESHRWDTLCREPCRWRRQGNCGPQADAPPLGPGGRRALAQPQPRHRGG